MVAIIECFLEIHSRASIGVLARNVNQNGQDLNIYKHGRVRKSYRVRIAYSLRGGKYNNSSLHLGVNWTQHKYFVAVPFRLAFMLLRKKLPCTLRPPEQGTLHSVLAEHSLAITTSPRYISASRTGVPNVPHCVG